jgi:hypothetical protein
MAIERVKVLHGHTDQDTAYVVDDYPYGFQLRCKIRYWVETATKGAAKGKQRFMSQTTNPKRPGEVWNKPKGSTYSLLVVMYLDGNGHVQQWGASEFFDPQADSRARLMGIFDQLDEEQREAYDALLAMSRRYQPQWDEWEGRVTALAEYIRQTGADPEISEGGIWTMPGGRLQHLSDPYVYLAVARQRVADAGN